MMIFLNISEKTFNKIYFMTERVYTKGVDIEVHELS
jgi:hypothetical protein